MQILAFGDSITNGSHVSNGWADQIRSLLYDRFHEENPDHYPRMYNLGIPGDTTNGLVTRFDIETQARVRAKYGSTIFLFSFGTNDVATIGTSSEHIVPIDHYEANLREVLEKAKNQTEHIAILTSPPVIEGRPNPNTKNRVNVNIQEYNSALIRLAKEYQTEVLDLYRAFEGLNLTALFNPDGVHPNAAGHALIVEVVKNYLLDILAHENI